MNQCGPSRLCRRRGVRAQWACRTLAVLLVDFLFFVFAALVCDWIASRIEHAHAALTSVYIACVCVFVWRLYCYGVFARSVYSIWDVALPHPILDSGPLISTALHSILVCYLALVGTRASTCQVLESEPFTGLVIVWSVQTVIHLFMSVWKGGALSIVRGHKSLDFSEAIEAATRVGHTGRRYQAEETPREFPPVLSNSTGITAIEMQPATPGTGRMFLVVDALDVSTQTTASSDSEPYPPL